MDARVGGQGRWRRRPVTPAVQRVSMKVAPPHGDAIRLDVYSAKDESSDSAVLLCHGFKGFKDWGFFPHLGRALAAKGHVAVVFDFSLNGVGEISGEFSELASFSRNTHSRELEDLHWMADELLAGRFSPAGSRRSRLGVFGHSRGGGEAVILAGERPDIDCLVTWAAVSSFERWTPEQIEQWEREGEVVALNARTGQEMPIGRGYLDDLRENRERFDVLAAASRIEIPWLIVHGASDAVAAPSEGRALAARARRAKLLEIEGGDHTLGARHPLQGRFTLELNKGVDATVKHFRRHLAQP